MDKYKIIRIFNIDRFNFLLPMLWVLLLASAVALSLLVILCIGAFDKELKYNAKLLLGFKLKEPTFRRSYAPELFAEIKKIIGLPPESHKVVTVGASPTIALPNGLQILDSYQNNHPLAYKYNFRKIIAGELAEDEALRNYFYFWGSRSYVFSAELGKNYLYCRYSPVVVQHLAIDAKQLKAMGGDYLIAAVPVASAASLHLNLKLVKSITNASAFWKFYLCQVR